MEANEVLGKMVDALKGGHLVGAFFGNEGGQPHLTLVF